MISGRRWTRLWLLAVIPLSACAHQPAPQHDAPGLWSGLVHGLTALGALIASLFWPVRPYAFPNSGFWYDVGFSAGFAFSIVVLILICIARIGGFITRGH
jgi:hypothetical protein